MVRLLNEGETIATSEGQAYSTRILRLRDHGECPSPVPACPKEQLFLAVSGFDEEPNQNLFKSQKAHRWIFMEWRTVPERDGPDAFLTAIFRKEVYTSNGTVSELVSFTYNPSRARAVALGRGCDNHEDQAQVGKGVDYFKCGNE